MSLYHITRPWYVQSILDKGLIPSYNKGLTTYGRVLSVVWLTDNPDYIIETQVGSNWEYSVLSVMCDELKIEPYKVRLDVEDIIVPHQYTYSGVISPTKVQVVVSSARNGLDWVKEKPRISTT